MFGLSSIRSVRSRVSFLKFGVGGTADTGGRADLIRTLPDLTIMMEWMHGPTTSPSLDMRQRGIAMVHAMAAEGFHF